MILSKKSRTILILGLLTLQTSVIISTEQQEVKEIELDEQVIVTEGGTETRAPNGNFNNLTVNGNLNVKGKADIKGNMIEFAKAEIKQRLDVKGVLDVKQNIDAGKNIICKGTVNAHHNVNAGHNIRATNDVTADKDLHVHHNAHIDNNLHVNRDGHFGHNLTVDGKLSAGNLVFTLSSTGVPSFSVCDLSVGCGLNLASAATVSIGGNLSLEGIASVNSIEANNLSVCDLTVGCALIGQPGASLSIDGFDFNDGSLSMSGDLNVAGMGSFGGSLIFGGDLLVNGNINMLNNTSPSAASGNINKSGLPFISNFGIDNTFIGVHSGNFTMTGAFNTGIGVFALNANTAGDGNTAVGYLALNKNTAGVENVAIGEQALVANTSGSANTAVGWRALFNNTTGTNNIAIGEGAGANIITTSNNIHIGNTGVTADANVIKIGTNGTHTSAFIEGVSGVAVVGSTVLINANGQLGTVPSSERYKENIEQIDRAWLLEKFAQIIPVAFSYRQDLNHTKMFGMIAEELDKVLPELVIKDKDGNPETIAYHLFIPLLIAVIQQLNDENKGLKEEVRDHGSRIERLERRG